MGRGWFRMPGHEGDRELSEQTVALGPALAECAGKRVLDLGCAEGCVSLEFAKAGAVRVLGIEREDHHFDIAKLIVFEGSCALKFKRWNLNNANPDRPLKDYDIVLALGIIHKLTLPETGLRWAARSAKELLLLRSGRGSVNGIIRGKISRNTCDTAKIMREEGFVLERTVDGPPGRDEPVGYWRRA